MQGGICQGALDILAGRSVNGRALAALRKMAQARQVEAAKCMLRAGNCSGTYAQARLAATPQSDLMEADYPKRIVGLTMGEIALIERETATVHQELKDVGASYGDEMLQLIVALGYVRRLIRNERTRGISTRIVMGYWRNFGKSLLLLSLQPRAVDAQQSKRHSAERDAGLNSDRRRRC